MTDTQKEMLQLYSEQDASGKELIFNMLLCAVVCGEPFYKEMQEFLEQGNKQASNARSYPEMDGDRQS